MKDLTALKEKKKAFAIFAIKNFDEIQDFFKNYKKIDFEKISNDENEENLIQKKIKFD